MASSLQSPCVSAFCNEFLVVSRLERLNKQSTACARDSMKLICSIGGGVSHEKLVGGGNFVFTTVYSVYKFTTTKIIIVKTSNAGCQ